MRFLPQSKQSSSSPPKTPQNTKDDGAPKKDTPEKVEMEAGPPPPVAQTAQIKEEQQPKRYIPQTTTAVPPSMPSNVAPPKKYRVGAGRDPTNVANKSSSNRPSTTGGGTTPTSTTPAGVFQSSPLRFASPQRSASGDTGTMMTMMRNKSSLPQREASGSTETSVDEPSSSSMSSSRLPPQTRGNVTPSKTMIRPASFLPSAMKHTKKEGVEDDASPPTTTTTTSTTPNAGGGEDGAGNTSPPPLKSAASSSPSRPRPGQERGVRRVHSSDDIILENRRADRGEKKHQQQQRLEISFPLFPEKSTSIWTPEWDHLAVKAYEKRHEFLAVDSGEDYRVPHPPNQEGISGYGWAEILKEEKEEPEAPPTDSYGLYMYRRRQQLRWEALMKKKAEKATRIQTLVRRFLGRLEFFERIRLRELDRKRQRCKDIENIFVSLGEQTQRDIAVLQHGYQKKKDQARDFIFYNFKQEGRREMVETRLLVLSKPQLEKEAKVVKTQGMALNAKLKARQAHLQKIKDTTAKLEQVTLEFQDLVKREEEALRVKEQLCAIESTHHRIFEAGLNRIVERIVAAIATATMTRDEIDLVESIRRMSRECQENLFTLSSVAISK